MEFRHVTDEGVFLNDKEIFLGATSEGGGQGYQVLTPLRGAERPRRLRQSRLHSRPS